MKVYFTDFFKKKLNLKLAIGALVMANIISANVPTLLGGHAESSNSIEFETPMTSDITVEEMRDLIYSSPNLTDEEKAFLYNEDLFTDILPYVNQSEWMKLTYRSKFSNMDVVSYNHLIGNMMNADGLYYPMTPGNLYIENYSGIEGESESAGTLAHEEVHAMQYIGDILTGEDSFFLEPTAEMMAHEYYGAPIENYTDEIRMIRVLMEIIGTEPIKQYIFTGDFSMIEERVKPYLDKEDYDEFIECIHEDVHGNNNLRNARLMRIFKTLYKNIYGSRMTDDEVLMLLEDDNKSLERSYFNERNQESYYVSSVHFAMGEDGWPNIEKEYTYLPSVFEKEDIFKNEHQL